MANSKIEITFLEFPDVDDLIKFEVNGIELIETFKSIRTTNFEATRGSGFVIEPITNYVSAFKKIVATYSFMNFFTALPFFESMIKTYIPFGKSAISIC